MTMPPPLRNATPEPGARRSRLTVLQVLPGLDGGGVERGTVEVANALTGAGHRSIVMSAGGRMVSEMPDTEHVAWPIGEKRLATWGYVRRLTAFLESRRPDVLHARSRLPGWVAYLAWRRLPPELRPRFITTVHGLYSVSRYSSVMARGERVIAVSNAVRDYLLHHYRQWVAPERITVIPRGVDTARYFPDFRPGEAWIARWKAENPALGEKHLVTLPARLTRLKGHYDFIELVARLRERGHDVHGLIVGGEDPRRARYARSVRDAIGQRGLSSHLSMLGHRDDLREILSRSHVAVSLSAKPESFGRTVLEALALGIPTIGYAHGGVGEILERLFPAGAVPPGDVAAAVVAVEHALAEPGPIARAPEYEIAQMLCATLRLYEQVVGHAV